MVFTLATRTVTYIYVYITDHLEISVFYEMTGLCEADLYELRIPKASCLQGAPAAANF